MKNFSLKFISYQVKSFSTNSHSYAHKPAIKFIGKRSLVHPQKHILHHEEGKVISQNFNPESLLVSPTSTLHMRPKLTEEQMAYVNTGGPTSFPDWQKVKLRNKKQI